MTDQNIDRTSRMSVRFFIVFAVSALLTAGGLTACDIGASSSATPTAPPAAAGVERGKAVFARYCNTCHPGGGRGAGPTLMGIDDSDEELRQIVRKGKARMPGYSEAVISNEELDDLVGYLNMLK